MAIRTDSFKVAGISYYQDDFIKKLKLEEDDGECEFDSSSVELVPEPENEYDPNAIKVMVDGVQIGHVPRKITSFVRDIMNSPDFSGMRVLILGELSDDEEFEESNLSATVYMYTREDTEEEQSPEKDYSILAKIELTLGVLLLPASIIISEIGFIIFALIIIAHSSYYLYKRKHK